MSRREYEILVASLQRWIDLERTARNTIAAEQLGALLRRVQTEYYAERAA